ncbi:hypothetical protein CIC12_07820 [Burkholderia sp. SG-MS1]|nr:hypothetical protein [Paraburkholderia sp. SG-MS1]
MRIVYQGYVVARGGKDLLGPEVANAVETASLETDEKRAIERWKEANVLLQKQAGIVPLLTFTRYFASSSKVNGFNVPAQNWYDLSKVWLTA